VHHSLLPVQKCNNVRDLYELPDLCPLNSPDLSTFISKYEAASSWLGFQGRDIFRHWISQKRHEI